MVVDKSEAALFVTRLAVAGSTLPNGELIPAPASLSTWRRNGFGHFLLILAMKFAASQLARPQAGKRRRKTGGPPFVHVYLQCNPNETAAMVFYKGTGFRDITPTPNLDNGYSLMSELAQSIIMKNREHQMHMFHKPTRDEADCELTLMCLSTEAHHFLVPRHSYVPDQTQEAVMEAFKLGAHVDGEGVGEPWQDDIADKFSYAAFPFVPKSPHVGQCLGLPFSITREQLDDIMCGLKNLLTLCPRTYKRNPKPPGSHALRGVMSAWTRAMHGRSTPLSSSCVQMFLALMLSLCCECLCFRFDGSTACGRARDGYCLQ